MSNYDGLDPEGYREQLLEMGASERDADAAVRELQKRQPDR